MAFSPYWNQPIIIAFWRLREKRTRSNLFNDQERVVSEACFCSGSKCSGSESQKLNFPVCLLAMFTGVPPGGVPACVENRVQGTFHFKNPPRGFFYAPNCSMLWAKIVEICHAHGHPHILGQNLSRVRKKCTWKKHCFLYGHPPSPSISNRVLLVWKSLFL